MHMLFIGERGSRKLSSDAVANTYCCLWTFFQVLLLSVSTSSVLEVLGEG